MDELLQQENVAPETEVDVTNEMTDNPQEAQDAEQQEDKQVPLHALQKERRKRQEAEERLKHYEQQKSEDDDSLYESVTKKELDDYQLKTLRLVAERNWADANPELYEKVNKDLPKFLKSRPNLVSAISDATNRYKEAWDLMSKLSPKQQKELEEKPKNQAPGSPSGVPKMAAMNDAMDVMSMSDAEFNKWRQSKRRKRG
jgi:Fe-S cluster biosynthesis and repair protein YggX